MSGFVARWTRATFLGWTLGFVLLLVFIGMSGAVGLGDTQFPIGLGMGTGVGLLQRRLINAQLQATTTWWRDSIIGVTAPFLAWDVAKLLTTTQIPYALAGAVVLCGLAVGALQGRVLRAHGANGTAWVAVSLLGWSLAAMTIAFNDRFLPKIPGIVGALLYIGVVLLGGVLLGATTGSALERILAARAPMAHVIPS